MEELDEQLPRPTARNPEETEDSEAQKAVNELAAALVAGLPESTAEMSADQHGPLAAGAVAELAPAGE